MIMRWDSSFPDVGTTRTRKKFLWLPKTINGETRWLEWARWEECFAQRLPPDHPDASPPYAWWVDLDHAEWHLFRWLPLEKNKPDKPYKKPSGSVTPKPPTST